MTLFLIIISLLYLVSTCVKNVKSQNNNFKDFFFKKNKYNFFFFLIQQMKVCTILWSF